VALVSGLVNGAEGAGNVHGELWPVVVLTALGEWKLLMVRRVSRARVSLARPGWGWDKARSWCRVPDQVFQLAVEDEGGIGELFFPREAEFG
jgi:hypothetical protein